MGTARTKRYCRLVVIDIANSDCYIEIGTIVVAKGTALNVDYRSDIERGYVDPTETETVPSGVQYITQRHSSRMHYSFVFSGLSNTSATLIDSVMENCGSHTAIALCLNTTTPTGNTLWVFVMEQNLLVSPQDECWEWTAQFREVL